MYTFVRSRDETMQSLKEQLELLAELPRHLKFELQYRKNIIKDSDTPASLGIDDRGRLRLKRRERTSGDSSDDITEVERKKHRRNLLKITVRSTIAPGGFAVKRFLTLCYIIRFKMKRVRRTTSNMIGTRNWAACSGLLLECAKTTYSRTGSCLRVCDSVAMTSLPTAKASRTEP